MNSLIFVSVSNLPGGKPLSCVAGTYHSAIMTGTAHNYIHFASDWNEKSYSENRWECTICWVYLIKN